MTSKRTPGISDVQEPDTSINHSSLFRHGNFLKLWIAQTVSLFGSQFTRLALPMAAVLTLHASPSQMGMLSAMSTAPFLIVSLFAGAAIDKFPRRPILIVSDLGRALLLLTIPIATVTHALGMAQIYVVAFLVGLLTVFFDVAYLAYLPAIVTREQLVSGNSKLEASRSIAQLGGPGIAGLIIQLLTAPIAILADALSFLLSAIFIGRIRTVREYTKARSTSSLFGDIREGVTRIFGDEILWPLAVCVATGNFFGHLWGSLYILFATRDLGLSAVAVGAISSVGNVAGLLGSVVATKLVSRVGIGRVIVGAAFVNGLCATPLFLATRLSALPLLLLSGLLQSFGTQVFNISQVSLRQTLVEPRLHGRVFATMRFLAWGTMPVGALLGGFVGEALGLRAAIGLGAMGSLLSFLWLLASPLPRLRNVPDSAVQSVP